MNTQTENNTADQTNNAKAAPDSTTKAPEAKKESSKFAQCMKTTGKWIGIGFLFGAVGAGGFYAAQYLSSKS